MEQFNRMVLALYGSAQECQAGEFDAHALSLLKTTLHFDSAAVVGGRMLATGMEPHTLHRYNQPIEKLQERSALSNRDEVLAKAMRRPGIALSQDAQTIDRRHTDVIAYCKKYDVAHTLVMVGPGASASNFNLLALWRAHRKNPYTAEELHHSDLLLPHLFQAKTVSRGLFAAKNAPDADGMGPLIARFDGCLQFADTAAIALLRSQWPAWQPPMLPAPLLDALSRGSERRYLGPRLSASLTVHGKLLYIRLARRAGQAALTPAEQRAAWLAAEGASYKAIARTLGISPATVRNQLHRVYAKLGVTSKAGLATALAPHGRPNSL